MEFHLAFEGKQEGPVPDADVRLRIARRSLRKSDMCWTAGWEAWRPLGEVFPEAFQDSDSAPIPSHESLASRPFDESGTPARRLPRRRDRTSAAIFTIAGVMVAGIAIFAIVWSAMREKPGDDPTKAAFTGPRSSAEFIGTHLEQVAQACLAYANAHGGKLPSYAAELKPLFGGRFEIVMDVPETQEIETNGYVVRMGVNTSMAPDTPIAFEARPRADGSRGVAYLDGHVRVYQRGDPELKRALQQ